MTGQSQTVNQRQEAAGPASSSASKGAPQAVTPAPTPRPSLPPCISQLMSNPLEQVHVGQRSQNLGLLALGEIRREAPGQAGVHTSAPSALWNAPL